MPCHIVTMAPLLSHTGLMTDGRREEVSEAETLLADRPDLVFGILIFSASTPVSSRNGVTLFIRIAVHPSLWDSSGSRKAEENSCRPQRFMSGEGVCGWVGALAEQ